MKLLLLLALLLTLDACRIGPISGCAICAARRFLFGLSRREVAAALFFRQCQHWVNGRS